MTDSARITFQVAGRTVQRDWDQITGAGLATYPVGDVTFPVDSIELPGGRRVPFEIVPFGGKLIGLSNELAATHRALLLGDGGTGFQVSLPVDDPGTQALLAELRKRLGSRWRGDAQELKTLRTDLGMRTTWPGRLLGLLFVIVVAVGGLLAIAAWAGVKAAWEEGDFALLQPVSLIALALWVVTVWYLLRRLGHLRR